MKKFMIFVLAAVFAVGFGTAFADNTVNLTDTTTTMRVGKGPVAMQDYSGTGTSAYVAVGNLQYAFDTAVTSNGVSIYAIDLNRTDAGGLMVKKDLTRALGPYVGTGVTLIGAPVVATRGPSSLYTGVSVFFLAAAKQTQAVGRLTTTTGVNPETGMTLYALDGASGTLWWQRGIAMNFMALDPGLTGTGTSIFASSPITIDTESFTTSGATIYGTAGVGILGNGQAGTGASVWAIDADTGLLVTNGVTEFPTMAVSPNSSVSGFFAAPVISGNSLYVIGWNGANNSVTMFAFDKLNLKAGVSKYGEIVQRGMTFTLANTMPTPTVSGNSIFVVAAGTGGWAGVTAYDKDTLAPQYTATIGPCGTSGVSASPVTDGSYVVISTMTAVTCYQINRLSEATTTGKWSIDLAKSPYTDGAYRIYGTPAISNGYVWVPVADLAANKGFLLRCVLNSTNGSATKVGNITAPVVADPIVTYDDVIAVSYNPTVTKITSSGAQGAVNWDQFKADKSKTGYNIRAAAAATVYDDDDSGCFISTIK